MTTPGTPTTGPDDTTAPEASAATAAHAGPRYWPSPLAGKDSPTVVAAAAISEAKARDGEIQAHVAEAEWRMSKITQSSDSRALEERISRLAITVRAAGAPGPATRYERARKRRTGIFITLWVMVAVLVIAALFGIQVDREYSVEVTVHPYAVLIFVLAVGVATSSLIAALLVRPLTLPDLEHDLDSRSQPAT